MDTKQKVKIVFDTDIGGDCDDAGALAMLHRLCDLEEAQLVAVTASYASPFVAGCIDAVNTYFGRKVPVGVCYDRTDKGEWIYGGALCKEFPNEYPESTFGEENGTPDAVKLLRKVLSQAEDHSITFVVTGSMTTAAGLVCSTPDEFSPLFGKELISQKICRTVVMGGSFYGEQSFSDYLERNGKDYAEWNILEDIASARVMCEEWPGEVVFSGFEIGLWCVTMKEYVEKAPTDSPVKRAYELHPAGKNGRESWDHTAILEAVRPGKYWYYHPWGQVGVNEDGVTRWYTKEGGKMSFLIPKVDYETLRQTIDGLVLDTIL